MTNDEEKCSLQVIEFCRAFNRKSAEQYAQIGARAEDIAIGALYSAFDLALAHKADPIAAIEFARTTFDVIERSIMSGETIQ